MQRTLLALGCGLAFAAGSAFAQQQGTSPKPANDAGGPTLTEKAKDAAQTIGEKAKAGVDKVKDMVQDSTQKGTADDAQPGLSAKSERMQKQADADFKTARAKCDAIGPRLQKTVCEKQAAVVHANAELRIAKAEAAAAPAAGKTASMGAGKSAR